MTYTTFYKKFGFPLIQRLLGRSTLTMFNELRASEMWPGNVIRQRQLSRLNELYRNVRKDIPFYAELYSNGPELIDSFEQFATLPVLDRRQVAENFREMVVGGMRNPNLLLSRTGGSSGEPLTFFSFKGSASLGLAMMMRGRAWWDVDFNERSALFIEHGLKFETDLRARVARALHHFTERLLNRVFFSAYRMSAKDMQNYYDKLCSFQPNYLIGYASFLYLFSKYCRDNQLSGRPLGVQCIFYTSEMLYSWQRQVIEEVFCCPVVGEYGCKELGVVAYECPHRRWHTMDESVYVEVLPLPAIPGYGEIILTQLLNDHSPLIRYRTGDLAAIVDQGESCACGRGLQVMGAIQGRSHDWIMTPSGKALHGQIFTHAIIARGSVEKFRVHQTKNFDIRIQAVVNARFCDEDQRFIIKSIKDVVGDSLEIIFERVSDIPASNSGKFRWIRSDISVYERSGALNK